ncbi:MAG: hypothetical protein C4330_10070 [Chitinophagaceae bacterium]
MQLEQINQNNEIEVVSQPQKDKREKFFYDNTIVRNFTFATIIFFWGVGLLAGLWNALQLVFPKALNIGDVLTGIIISLLAQGYSSVQAAIFGVYIHGLAGDFAAKELSQEAMLVSDITHYLGAAFLKINNSTYVADYYYYQPLARTSAICNVFKL